MPYVETNRTRLFYSEWGQGRPALFVHAWGLSGDMWSYQVASLAAAGLRCVTFDRRGHGRSDRPSTGYDLDSLADDVAAVIEALDLRDVLLVGHSMGAAEAVRYLIRHGAGRIDRLVLSAPVTPFLVQTDDNPAGVPRCVLDAGVSELNDDVGAWVDARWAGYWGVRDDVSPALGEWTRRQIVDTPAQILLATTRAFTYTDLRSEVASVTVPTMVIQGDADNSCPLEITGRPTAELIRGAQLTVLPGAGHGLYVSQAARYNAELLSFAGAGIPSTAGRDQGQLWSGSRRGR